VVSLLVVAGVGIGIWRYRAAHQPPPVNYETVPITKRHVVGRITATGTLLATVTVTVGSQVSGRIAKLGADWNSPVKKGQLIAKIDPLLFQAALEQTRANLLSARATLTSSKAQADLAAKQLAREQQLLKENLAAQQDVDTAQSNASVTASQVDVAAASVAQAEASLHQAQTNLSYTDIISPIDGTVISRSVDVGQTVAASLQAPVLFTIAQDLTKMQVNTNVSEGDVGRLEEGMPATFTVDAYPGDTFKGTVSQIRNAATTVSNVVTYDAVIDVDNTDGRLRPGMTANATVTFADKRNVVAVPNASLRFRPPPESGIVVKGAGSGGAGSGGGAGGEGHHRMHDGGAPPAASAASSAAPASSDGADAPPPARGGGMAGGGRGKGARDAKSVWLLRDGAPVQVPVETGLSDGAYTEITDDSVKEGDTVIVDATVNGKEAAPTAPTTTQRRSPF
jgi:HlyD family secretion protein